MLFSAESAVAAPVRELTDRPWQVTILTDDAGLAGRYVFDLVFEPDGTAWVAASGGLRRYDGYGWETFSTNAGLPSSFVRSVLRTRDGVLWVGTDQGAGVFDPERRKFDRRGSERGLAGPSVRRMFEDPDGTIWFCSDRWPEVTSTGGLTSWKDGVWTRYGVAEGLPSQDVMEYLRDSRGRQYAATTQGMVEREGARWRPLPEPGLPEGTVFWALGEAEDGTVLAQTSDAQRSIYALQDGRWSVVRTNVLALFATGAGEVYVTDSEGQGDAIRLLQWEDGVLVPIASTRSHPNFAAIQQARLAPDGAVWLAGRSWLARWQVAGGEWASYEGLPRPRLLDPQGTVWFGDSQGVVCWSGSGFVTVPGARGPVWADGSDGVWTRTESGLVWIAGSRRTVYADSVTGMRQVERGLPDVRGGMWFQGRGADDRCVVARFDGEQWSKVWLGDLASLEVRAAEADLGEGIWLVFRDRSGRSYELGRVREDRIELEPFAGGKPPLSNPGLAIDHHGCWLYGFAGLYHLPADRSTGWRRVEELASRGFVSHASSGGASIFLFLEDDSGQPGVALYRQGRWEQRPVVLRAPVVVRHQVMDSSVLFGSQGGFNILRPEQQEEPSFVPLPVDTTVTALVQDREGSVWLGTTAGVLRFQPGTDPPRTELRASASEIQREGTLHVGLRAVKRWAPASAQSAAQFSWRVDGGQWSRFSRATTVAVQGKDVAPGTHRFEVRAMDAVGRTDARGAALVFRVFPTPLERRPWFRLTIVGIAGLVLLLAAIAWGRARQTAAANAALRLEVERRQEAEVGLQQAHGLLEHRVEQRTQQLSRANALLLREIAERKQTQQALEESEMRFRSIVQQSSDVITLLSPDSQITYISPQSKRILGYRPEELVGKAAMSFIHEDDLPRMQQALRRVVEGATLGIPTEFRFHHARGHWVYLEALGTNLLKHPGIHGLLVTIRDVTERNLTQEALRQKTEELDQFFTVALDLLCIADLDGRFRRLNPQWEQVLGYPLSELEGGRFLDLVHPDDQASTQAVVGELASRKAVVNFVNRYRCRDGSYRWIEWRSTPAGDRIYAAARDITDRKRVEEALRESMGRLQTVVTGAPIVLYSFDRNGVFTLSEGKGLSGLGLRPGQIVGQSVFEVYGDQPKAIAALRRALAGETFTEELSFTAGGTFEASHIALHDEAGAYAGTIGVLVDITERKRTEEAAARERALLRAVIDLLPDGVYLKDTDSRFLLVNQALARRLGKESTAAILGLRDADLFPPEAAAAYRADEEAVLAGAEVREKEETVVFPNGETLTILTTKVPFRDGSGKIIGVLGTGHNITVRKQAEQQIQKLNTELERRVEERTAQLAAANRDLEAFAYSVSHDLRAPLRSIDGFTRILAEDYAGALDAEGHRLCGVIRNNTQRMGQLIDDLLTFSRFGRTEMQWRSVDMESLARAAFHELKTLAERGPLDFREGPMPGAVGDPNLLRQVWVNLLSNAVKFTSKQEHRLIEVGGELRGEESVYWVRDNGVGFDMQHAGKLFGVFERLHSQQEFEGTGVGLAIVQRVIHRHGGRVWAEAAVGQGATFSFSLPHKPDRP